MGPCGLGVGYPIGVIDAQEVLIGRGEAGEDVIWRDGFVSDEDRLVEGQGLCAEV
jgi:hypothetical protein